VQSGRFSRRGACGRAARSPAACASVHVRLRRRLPLDSGPSSQSRAFEDLPAFFEGPGVEGKRPAKADMDRMRKLRAKRAARRKRRAG